MFIYCYCSCNENFTRSSNLYYLIGNTEFVEKYVCQYSNCGKLAWNFYGNYVVDSPGVLSSPSFFRSPSHALIFAFYINDITKIQIEYRVQNKKATIHAIEHMPSLRITHHITCGQQKNCPSGKKTETSLSLPNIYTHLLIYIHAFDSYAFLTSGDFEMLRVSVCVRDGYGYKHVVCVKLKFISAFRLADRDFGYACCCCCCCCCFFHFIHLKFTEISTKEKWAHTRTDTHFVPSKHLVTNSKHTFVSLMRVVQMRVFSSSFFGSIPSFQHFFLLHSMLSFSLYPPSWINQTKFCVFLCVGCVCTNANGW